MRKIIDPDQDLQSRFRNSYSGRLDLEPLRAFCRKYGERIEFSRRSYFQRTGERSIRLAYIERGGVRYLHAAADGRQRTVGFGFEGGFAVDWQAFVRRGEGMLDIRMLADSTLLVVDSERFFEFMDGNDRLRCRISEGLFATVSDSLMDFYLLSPEQRYLKFMARNPRISERLSMREIASFIGIEPESLSRIRRRLCGR